MLPITHKGMQTGESTQVSKLTFLLFALTNMVWNHRQHCHVSQQASNSGTHPGFYSKRNQGSTDKNLRFQDSDEAGHFSPVLEN